MPQPSHQELLKLVPAELRDGQGLRSSDETYLMGATPEGDFALFRLDPKLGRFVPAVVEGFTPDTADPTKGILKLGNGDALHMAAHATPLINGKPTTTFELQQPEPAPAPEEVRTSVDDGLKPHRFPHLKQGAKNPPGETKLMQEMLRDLGFGKQLGKFGPEQDGVDDKFGGFTASAVRAFQIANDMLPTGELDAKTGAKLAEKHLEQQRAQMALVAASLDPQPRTPPAGIGGSGPTQLFNDMGSPRDTTHILYQQLADSAGVTLRSSGGIDLSSLSLPEPGEGVATSSPQMQRPRPGSPGMGGGSL